MIKHIKHHPSESLGWCLIFALRSGRMPEWGCLGLTSTAPNLLTPSKRPSHHQHYHDHDHHDCHLILDRVCLRFTLNIVFRSLMPMICHVCLLTKWSRVRGLKFLSIFFSSYYLLLKSYLLKQLKWKKEMVSNVWSFSWVGRALNWRNSESPNGILESIMKIDKIQHRGRKPKLTQII